MGGKDGGGKAGKDRKKEEREMNQNDKQALYSLLEVATQSLWVADAAQALVNSYIETGKVDPKLFCGLVAALSELSIHVHPVNDEFSDMAEGMGLLGLDIGQSAELVDGELHRLFRKSIYGEDYSA
jgi:hypothetical protein